MGDGGEFFIGLPIQEAEELRGLVGERWSDLAGSQFDLVAFDAADDQGLGGVPADLFVLGGEQTAERVDRLVIGLRGHEPFGLEECGDPPVGVVPRPAADRAFVRGGLPWRRFSRSHRRRGVPRRGQRVHRTAVVGGAWRHPRYAGIAKVSRHRRRRRGWASARCGS